MYSLQKVSFNHYVPKQTVLSIVMCNYECQNRCFCPKVYMLGFCIEYDIGWTICECKYFVYILQTNRAVVPHDMGAYRGTEVIYTGLFYTL